MAGIYIPGAVIIGSQPSDNSGGSGGGECAPDPVICFDYLTQQLPRGMIFTRASSAAYYDDTLRLQSAANNTPRYGYNPVSNKINGLMIEQSATNYLRQGTDLSLWSIDRCTVEKYAGNSPVDLYTLTSTQSSAGFVQSAGNFPVKFADKTTVYTTFYVMSESGVIRFGSNIISGWREYRDLNLNSPPNSVSVEKFPGDVYRVRFSTISSDNENGGVWFYSSVNEVQAFGGVTISTSATSSDIITNGQSLTRAPDVITIKPGRNSSVYREYITYGSDNIVKEIVDGEILPVNFQGWLRRLRVYNRLLTDSEKAELLP